MTVEEFFNKAARLIGLGSVSVTPRGSLSLPAVYTCIKILQETIGMLPIHHYSKTSNGRELINSDLSNVVTLEPNPNMTAADFYGTWVANAAVFGYGIIVIERTAGRIQLRLAPSEWVVIDKMSNGDLSYDIYWHGRDKNYQRYYESDVLHLKGVGFDGQKAYGAIEYAAEAYGFALSTQKYGHEFFKNGAHLKGFIEMPAGVSIEGRTKEEKLGTLGRIKNAVLSGLRGESSAGGIGVLENGMKFSAMSLPNDQAQFLESRKFSREEIAAMFRIPSYMVGEMGNAIKSNIEQQSIEFIQYAIMPWLVKMEQELKRKLLRNKKDEYFKFNVNSYLRGTALDRAQYYKEMRYAGLITEEEARSLEDLPKVPKEGRLLISKNVWGNEEYDLMIEKLKREANADS